MANITLDLSQFKASGIYTIEYDQSQSVVINTQTTRLVVGFSKQGPINAPVFCPDVKTARRIFGDIDRTLESKGSFFHRSLFTCLETGPCFALVLMPLNNGQDSSYPTDTAVYNSFSLSVAEANGSTAAPLYSSYFNKERFYFPDESYFLATVDANTLNVGKLFSLTNLGQTPFSVICRKSNYAGDLPGFAVTARDWFGPENVPSFIKPYDFISDYFINVDIVAGNWTDFETLSVDPVFSQFFNTRGLIPSQYSAFLANSQVNQIASFQGSLIPDLTDDNGVNYSIDTIINNGVSSTGLFCTLDRDALNNYDPTATNLPGRVDMIGHSLINSPSSTVNFLSYMFTASESEDYTQQISHSPVVEIDFGTGATSNLPGGLGSTGASYSASANGYSANDPSKAVYLTSFYSTGNQGKFNNVLNIRKEALSASQYTTLSTLTAGSSIILEAGTGATHYATVASVNEVTIGSNVRVQIGISHPDKLTEGSSAGKNALILNASTSSSYLIVGGTGAASSINNGDWIYTSYNNTRYYFRVTSTGLTGSNSQLFVDTTNSEFNGATNLTNLVNSGNMTFFTAYWESTYGVSGSLFDVIDVASSDTNTPLIVVSQPNEFNYESVAGGPSYYYGYEYSPLYQAFNNGILASGDSVYVNTLPAGTPLYLSATFTNDVDAISVVNVNAYYDSALTQGYTGSWSFSQIWDSSGATVTPTALQIYALTGDYTAQIGATGFNTTRTICYVPDASQSTVSVGQYIVADPVGNQDPTDYVLTKVLTKKKISSTSSNYIPGYSYQIAVNQRMANYNGNILRFKTIDQVAPSYQPTFLSGFKITGFHLPDGSDTQLGNILGMLDPANSGLYTALSSRHVIVFRYIIDTFNGGLGPQSTPKNLITLLAQNRQKCLAIMNAPSIQTFIKSTDPQFTDPATASNPKPVLQTAYIAAGGNLSLSPSFTYSLPDENNGAKFSGFFSPFLTIRENGKNVSIPPAADVSNNFIRKFINGQPYSIVAGTRRGVLSNPLLVGLEYDFSDADRANLEPFGWNPIVYRRGVGYMIFGNQTAYQKTLSQFNNLHVRDLLITIEESIEDILQNFLYEYNDASTRLQVKSIVDAYLDNVMSAGGLNNFETVIDETNNTPDIISQDYAIIDVAVEPLNGMQKFINRVTVLKNGTIASGGFTIA